MQKSLAELTSMSHREVSQLLEQLGQPLLVTTDGEPQFVAHSLDGYESMVRRLRELEAERRFVEDSKGPTLGNHHNTRGRVIPFRRTQQQ